MKTEQTSNTTPPPTPAAGPSEKDIKWTHLDPNPRTYYNIWRFMIRDERLTHAAFHVLHCLHDHCDSTLETFVGRDTIVKEAGCSNDTIKPVMDLLTSTGWIEHNQRRSGARRFCRMLDGTGKRLTKCKAPSGPETVTAANRGKKGKSGPKTRTGQERSYFSDHDTGKCDRSGPKTSTVSEEAPLGQLSELNSSDSLSPEVASAPACASAGAAQPSVAPGNQNIKRPSCVVTDLPEE